MKIAPSAINEQEKLKALKEYFIPYTITGGGFEDITLLASAVCGAPVCFISLSGIDAQCLKSIYGISAAIAPAFFFDVNVEARNVIIHIPNLADDTCYNKNTLLADAPYIVFFACVPLTDADGNKLGALCIADNKPGSLAPGQTDALKALGRQAARLLELQKKKIQLQHKKTELAGTLGDQEQITRIASHDLKSPLNNIISLTHLLKDGYSKQLDDEGNEYITYLNESAYHLSDLISGIVLYSKSSQLPVDHKEDIPVNELIADVTRQLNIPASVTVKYKKNDAHIFAPPAVIRQVLLQLLHNAVQYNTGNSIKAEVAFSETEHSYTFEIKDNGPGIAYEDQEKIFNLFERLQKNKDGESMGIGLAISKRLVQKMGGTISIESAPGKGCSFIFTVPK